MLMGSHHKTTIWVHCDASILREDVWEELKVKVRGTIYLDKISVVGQCALTIKVGYPVSCKFILEEKEAAARPISNTACSEIL